MIKTTDVRPTALHVNLSVGEVIISVQNGLKYGSVVLEPIRADDEDAAWMIENAEVTTSGSKLVVKVPDRPGSGDGVVIQGYGGSISIGRGSMVVGSNVTIRNGQIISGGVVQIGTSGVRAKIAIPSDVKAKVRGESTEVLVKGMLAALDVRTTNGGVSSGQHQKEVEIDTTNGSITLESVGTADIHSTNGSIVVQRASGKTKLRATNGSIEATTTTEDFTARTTNGSCYVVADGVDLDDDAVSTTNGHRKLMRR